MENQTNVSTTVEQVTIDNLEDVFALPGAENLITPPDVKKTVFSTDKVDTSFIDKPEEDDLEEAKVTLNEVITELNTENTSLEEETAEEKKGGRSKLSKDGTVQLVKKLIEAGKIIPFEDEKPIEEYSMNDFEELFDANFKEIENRLKEETPVEFFESLPDELKIAAKYVADGGNDLKSLFKVLSQVEETRELNVEDPNDQERIVREYLLATNFGTPEEIEEEIISWKDREELGNKAAKFKPKLDAMHSKIVQQKIAQQEDMKRMQQEQAKKYVNNVYDTLKAGELGGLKLDKKTQELLYTGLVQPNYASITGRPTNLLGHLLEKYQYVEPNHALIAEALWLLNDPEGYKTKVRAQGEAQAVETHVRMLKTAEQSRTGGGSTVIEKEEVRQRRIPRNRNIFER